MATFNSVLLHYNAQELSLSNRINHTQQVCLQCELNIFFCNFLATLLANWMH